MSPAEKHRHILVPLDGSPAAETALPEAALLAELCGATITLLQAVPLAKEVIETGAEPIAIDQQEAVRQQAARGYLESVRRRPVLSGRATVEAVGVGEPAEVILDHAARQGVDLIVMATHGRSGFRRWMLGSTAEKIVHAASQPVLLVRAGSN